MSHSTDVNKELDLFHCLDWVEENKESQDPNIRLACQFLDWYSQPVVDRLKDPRPLKYTVVTCVFDDQRYRLTGCSRFGDIWLAEDLQRSSGYDLRVDIRECTDWKVL